MGLSPGSRLGYHEIVGLIGEGGMGQVYRAIDTRLNRQVAIKVLPEAHAGDPERIARFQREAELLAALNHPNIAAVYGVEDAGPSSSGHAMLAIVMELVDGETLADRIARGPLELDEVVSIARQTADALEAAHDRGVVHRDFKPANIKVRPDGRVKVLDFGLAKMLTPREAGTLTDSGEPGFSPADSPTMTSPPTFAKATAGKR